MVILVLTILGGSTRSVSFRNTLHDRLVPLLLGLAVKDSDDHHRHVVATNSAGVAARSQTVVHQVLANAMQVLLGGNSPSDELDHRLRRLAIPDTCFLVSFRLEPPEGRVGKQTVTCNNEELVVGSDVVHNNIGEGGNDLLLRRKVGALLEFEIANGS